MNSNNDLIPLILLAVLLGGFELWQLRRQSQPDVDQQRLRRHRRALLVACRRKMVRSRHHHPLM